MTMPRGRAPACALSLLALVALCSPPAGAHGTLAERLASLDDAIARRPSDPALHLDRATLLRDEGSPAQALEEIDRAAALGADAGLVARERGRALLALGRTAEAERALARAVSLRHTDAAALAAHGTALADLGRGRSAAVAFARALDAAPRGAAAPDWALARAHALASEAPPDLDGAIRGLDQDLARLGPLVVLEQEAVRLEERAGRVDAALARLDRVSAGAVRREGFLLQRAEILERAGRREPALAAYAGALAAIDRLTPQRIDTPMSRRLAETASAGVARLAVADAGGAR